LFFCHSPVSQNIFPHACAFKLRAMVSLEVNEPPGGLIVRDFLFRPCSFPGAETFFSFITSFPPSPFPGRRPPICDKEPRSDSVAFFRFPFSPPRPETARSSFARKRAFPSFSLLGQQGRLALGSRLPCAGPVLSAPMLPKQVSPFSFFLTTRSSRPEYFSPYRSFCFSLKLMAGKESSSC